MGAATVTQDLRALTEGPHVHRNLSTPQLVETAIARGEASLAANGALVALTGARTGRSPRDKFTVEDAETKDRVDWGKVNQPFPPDKFQALLDRVVQHMAERDLYVMDLYAGADRAYRLPIQIICEYAWHALFVKQLFVRPELTELAHHAAGIYRDRRSRVRGDSGTRRHSLRHVHPRRFHPQSDPDRRHQVRRRDEEVHLRRDELPAARARCLPHALLGEYWREWRDGALLRPVRDGQNDALRRSSAPPDRRRRAWLEPGRSVSISKADATPSASTSRKRRSRRFITPSALARCWRTWSSTRRQASPTTATFAIRRTRERPIPLSSSRMR